MSKHDVHTKQRLVRWAVPAICVTGGLAYLVAGWLGDQLEFGFFGLALGVVSAVVVVLAGRRSETVAGLMDRRDERINDLDLRASVFAGLVVVIAVLVMFVVEIARGRDGSPYFQLGALGGLSYLVALVYLRYRR